MTPRVRRMCTAKVRALLTSGAGISALTRIRLIRPAKSALDQETAMTMTKRFALALTLISILFTSGSLLKVRAGSGFDNSSLNGTYGFAFSGLIAKGNHPFCIGGSWNFHGDGTFDGFDTVQLDGLVSLRNISC